ncbi:hypothetical protein Anas_11267, partial [Armadillidium nasatum]
MKVERDQMIIKEEPNPNFDEKKMIREGCKYVGNYSIIYLASLIIKFL